MPRPRPTRDRWMVIAATVVGALPVLVAVVAMGRHDWHPIGDLAQANLRMDSFWAHPPLVGPAGRIAGYGRQGNHPGPAMFWVAWPLWRLLGGSPWANQASVAAVSVAAYAAAVAVAWRRRGTTTALVVALVGAVLMRSFGAVAMTTPWNPFTPLVPFLLFVVLAWLAACGAVRLLPATVAVGSFCIQCHVGYAPAVVAGVLVAVAGPTFDAVMARRRAIPVPGSDEEDRSLGRVVRWTALGLVAGLVVWAPPIVDQVVHDPGNMRILLAQYRDQSGHVVGLGTGARVLLTQLNPAGNWLRGTRTIVGSIVPGALLVVAWAAAAVVAVRARHRALTRLNVLLAALTACAWLWAARLDVTRFLYLVEWFWVLTAFMVVSVVGSARLLVDGQAGAEREPFGAGARLDLRRAGPTLAGVALVASSAVFTWTAAGVEPPDMRYSRTLDALIPATVDRLDRTQRYSVEWVDPDALGGYGFGLVLALDQRGFDVGADPPYSAAVEPHRVLDPVDADAVVTIVSGDDQIAKARTLTAEGVTELAHTDHRSPAERRRYRTLRDRAQAQLRAAGLDDLADSVTVTIWQALVDERTPDDAFATLSDMLALGQATAVYLSPRPLPPLT